MPVKLTQEELDKIIELGKTGKRQKDIASWFRISISKVCTILNSNGVRRYSTQRSWNERHR